MTLPEVDFSLLRRDASPIAGPGSETLCPCTGWSWCKYCGYTGRVAGPTQQACPERNDRHRWLARNVDLLPRGG